MAAPATLPALLSTLTQSLTSASSSLPETKVLAPPAEGISLLDTKNELLLSYLHNLVFLIILKLRTQRSPPTPDSNNGSTPSPSLQDAATKKLTELRIYLEKGVRPLEARLKYQLDKLLLAASEASTSAPPTNGTAKLAPPQSPKPADDSASHSSDAAPPSISDLAHRPNPSAFARPSQSARSTTEERSSLYRPPRIKPTALPTTTPSQRAKEAKPRKSHTMDAFIREEMDDAPIAEPSIGAGSGLSGRAREREEERRGYEEQRLVRLPGEKKRKGRRADHGGEDLVGGLGGLGDLDFGEVKGGRGKRKREEGGESGERVGDRWEKRVKRGVGRNRR